ALDHVYALPTAYTNNNGVLVDTAGSGQVAFATPAAFSALSFLGSSGGGNVTVGYTITHQGGDTQTGTFVVPDWFNGTPSAFTSNGRVNVDNGAFDSVNGGNPRLYSVDIAVTNSTSPVMTIDLVANEGAGHVVIFAVSGATGSVSPIFD